MELPTNENLHQVCGEVIFNKGLPDQALGAVPNPFAPYQVEWQRRKDNAEVIKLITDKIESLFEPRFITPPETTETLEKLITMTNAKKVLELGMYSGFGTLHFLRAVVGKEGHSVTSVECRPAYDREFFHQPSIGKHFRFVQGWTPDALDQFRGEAPFDFVFMDSDHSVAHNEKERLKLIEITKPGSIWCFHDLPEWPTPDNRVESDPRKWVNGLVTSGFLRGHVFPTPSQLDCEATWGKNYPLQCSPHLGIFQRMF